MRPYKHAGFSPYWVLLWSAAHLCKMGFVGSVSETMHSGARKRKAVPIIDKRYSCFRLRVGPSRIDRYGVYACESIPPGRKVIEYTGKLLTVREFNREFERQHHGRPPRRVYGLGLSRKLVVDGSRQGCGAQYINHSCDPNLFFRRVRGHALLFSLRGIARGEELSYDYQLPRGWKSPCRCGSPKCRGTINLR